MEWSLPRVLKNLHDDIHRQLENARTSFGHPGTTGDASETVWLELLQAYLPKRYQAEKAHVVDSNGVFSQQIDVVVFDRQYSPFIFDFKGQKIVPAESVYAVFEAKQEINATMLTYGAEKIASVRNLHRTSLPIPHAGGTYPPKLPGHIMGGFLSFESGWSPALGSTLASNLASHNGAYDIGCVAAHGYFQRETYSSYKIEAVDKPATAFLFHLIASLQQLATVSMIDVLAYADWLTPDEG